MMQAPTDKPAITAIAPWFGAKRNLAPTIVGELGDHRVYWEPFCGSMAVLGIKDPCVMETVNDLHADLINLARVIQHQTEGPKLYRRARRALMAETLFNESREVIHAGDAGDVLDGERAYHYFLTAWLGMNGIAGTARYNAHYAVRYTANGGHAAKRWDSVVGSIPWWRRRLRNVTILRRDAFDLLGRIGDDAGTAIYVDPPYIRKGAKYKHDLAVGDHARLAELLGRFNQARVVVSYYAEPELLELYPDWTRVEIDVSKAMACAGQRGECDKRATEVLLINGPSYAKADEPNLWGAAE